MIALDTNILVHARRRESAHHGVAARVLRDLAEGDKPWAIPWPCIYEFVRVVTHPRVFDPPSPLDEVLDDLDALMQSPSLTLLGAGPSHAAHFLEMTDAAHATGNLAHDAHIAALIHEHGVRELWTTDRDFARFPLIRTQNPFETTRTGERRRRYRAGTRRRKARAGSSGR